MDLTTTYLGLELENPLVAAASPLSHTLEGVHRLVDAGVGAVVLHSLFEEELAREDERHATLGAAGTESFAESLTYFPEAATVATAGHRYLDLVERAAATVDIPVIASLNGTTTGGWTGYARKMEDAGAAAVELNLYSSPTDAHVSGRDIEEQQLEVVRLVRDAVSVPVAVKISPYYSSVGEMARRLEEAGADGLVMFNRFLHPEVDPEALRVVGGLGLSTPADVRLPCTWIALLRHRLQIGLAASTGVEGPEDLARFLLAGADVVTTASALLRHGPEHARALLEGLTSWMEVKGFGSLGQLRGLLAVPADVDETASERAGYVAALRSANAVSRGPW